MTVRVVVVTVRLRRRESDELGDARVKLHVGVGDGEAPRAFRRRRRRRREETSILPGGRRARRPLASILVHRARGGRGEGFERGGRGVGARPLPDAPRALAFQVLLERGAFARRVGERRRQRRAIRFHLLQSPTRRPLRIPSLLRFGPIAAVALARVVGERPRVPQRRPRPLRVRDRRARALLGVVHARGERRCIRLGRLAADFACQPGAIHYAAPSAAASTPDDATCRCVPRDAPSDVSDV